MRKEIQIGDKFFKFKKDALNYYKLILNSYKFGQSLSDDHFNDLIDLISYSPDHKTPYELENKIEEENSEYSNLEIIDIKVSEVQFRTKCFEIFWNDNSSEYISYISLINRNGINYHKYFNSACRNCIQDDMIALKQKYFSENSIKGFVKCQETKILSKWDDLAVDHRQPNTFSVIVDRFKELNQLDIEKMEYVTEENNIFIFADKKLVESFRLYHKEKANLRVVRKEQNLSRTNMARLKQSPKDLKIE